MRVRIFFEFEIDPEVMGAQIRAQVPTATNDELPEYIARSIVAVAPQVLRGIKELAFATIPIIIQPRIIVPPNAGAILERKN